MLKQLSSKQLNDMMAYWYLESGQLGKKEQKKQQVQNLKESMERFAGRKNG